MGQYYTPILIEGKKVVGLYSFHYDNGLRLMEHSWVGNSFVNAVLGMIKDYPMRVAWIGDYSNDEYGDLYEKKIPHDKFMRYYDKAWGDGKRCLFVNPVPMEYSDEVRGYYLVNHTRKTYVDMDRYNEDNVFNDGWVVNPLPLLTACGNGRGSGDYYKKNPDYDKVGAWAFDKIEFTQDKPEGYTEEEYSFKEVGE